MYFDILSGIYIPAFYLTSRILFDIYIDSFSGILSGICSDILSGSLSVYLTHTHIFIYIYSLSSSILSGIPSTFSPGPGVGGPRCGPLSIRSWRWGSGPECAIEFDEEEGREGRSEMGVRERGTEPYVKI